MLTARPFLGGVIALVAAMSAVEAQVPLARDTAMIRRLYREWPRAVEASDPARYASFLDDSVTLLVPGAPSLHGAAAYKAALVPMFEAARFHVALMPAKMLEVAGLWAFVHYDATLTTIPKSGGDSTVARNRYVDILKRQPDGSWRIYVHSFQAAPPPQAK